MYELSYGDLVVVPFGNIPDRPTKARVGVVMGEPYDYGENGDSVVDVGVFGEGPFSVVMVSVCDVIPLAGHLDMAAMFGLNDQDLLTLYALAREYGYLRRRENEFQQKLSAACQKTPYLLWSDVRGARKGVKEGR